MKTKCILFDADGIIINSEMFSIQYQKKFEISNDDMLPFFEGEFQQCLVGKGDLKELLEPWLKKWRWEGNVNELLEFWFKCQSNVNQEIVELINKIKSKGIKCFLATNQEIYRTNYIRKEMCFENIFDKVFSSAEVGFKKPEREFYEYILKELKEESIDTNEIMFFDDSQGHIDEAKKIGINAHFYEGIELFKKSITHILKEE